MSGDEGGLNTSGSALQSASRLGLSFTVWDPSPRSSLSALASVVHSNETPQYDDLAPKLLNSRCTLLHMGDSLAKTTIVSSSNGRDGAFEGCIANMGITMSSYF